MGGYELYLKQLLQPLQVYDLKDGSISESELYAAGGALDLVAGRLERAEREALTATAEQEGLEQRESLFSKKPAATTLLHRRRAIAALMQIDGDSLTPSAINTTLQGCGIRAKALEMGGGKLRVIFPDVAGIPSEFQQIRDVILEILPCHLEVEFYFRYLTWEECERAAFTWEVLEMAEYTWETFELAVPAEE